MDNPMCNLTTGWAIFVWTFVWRRSTITMFRWWPFRISSLRTLYLHTDWRRANHAFAGNQEIDSAATRIEQGPSDRAASIRYATRLLPLWISRLIPFPLCCCFPEIFGLNPLGRCIKGSCCDCLQSVFEATRSGCLFLLTGKSLSVTYERLVSQLVAV